MPGELTVVYGPPAAGKSVLVRMLTGLEQPDSGRIILRGQDVTHEAPAERNIGYVPQSFALYPHLSVRSNNSYPLDLAACAGIGNARGRSHRGGDAQDRRASSTKARPAQRWAEAASAIARGIAKRTDFFVLDDPGGTRFSSCGSSSSTTCGDSIRNWSQHPLCHV